MPNDDVYILYARGGGMVQIEGVVTQLTAAKKWSDYSPSNTWRKVALDDPDIYSKVGARRPRKKMKGTTNE